MQAGEIQNGKFYTDGKHHVRKVIRRPKLGEGGEVRYRVIAGRGAGRFASCWITTFAAWARREVDEPAAEAADAELSALRVVVQGDCEIYEVAVPRGLPRRVHVLIARGLLYEHEWTDVDHDIFVDDEPIADSE